MISRWVRLSMGGAMVVRQTLRPIRPFSTRTRSSRVEPIVIKKTQSTKRIIDFYKDMTVKELSDVLEVPFDDVVDVLVNFDKRNMNRALEDSALEQDHVARAITAFNCKPRLQTRVQKVEIQSEDIEPQDPAPPSECIPRRPVVTIMGHVDHGKTTLLDSLRNSRIVDGEFGGITQHIGAFSVYLPKMKRSVTFLDTPGHAAFSNMRSRGASVTDIVVLVVAADDGVKEQTAQSILFAREAGVPIVVAINKCDKPAADPARTRRTLLEQEVVVEDMGGDVQCVEISALHGKNLDALQEAILAQADLLDLRAPAKGLVEGHVIESSLLPGLGKTCTVLLSRGSLKKGRVLVAGTAYTRVRTMTDETGKEVAEALPGTAIRISGWKDTLPSPGDVVLEAKDSAQAEKAIKWRTNEEMNEKAEKDAVHIQRKREDAREKYLGMRNLLLQRGWRNASTNRSVLHRKNQFKKREDGDGIPKLRLILRTDVEGSLEAILDVIDTYSSSKVKLQLIDFGVGPPTAKDIETASNAEACIYTFNVETSPAVRKSAAEGNVQIKPFNVVYRLIENLKDELTAAIPKDTELVLVGQGHVLKEFMIPDRNKKYQPIAGVLVDWGNFQKNCVFRFSRNNEVFYEGSVETMKNNADSVSSATTNTEVGLALDDKAVRFKTDDSVEVFEKKDVNQTIDWYPAGF